MPLDVNAQSVNNITDLVDFTNPVFQSGDSTFSFKYYTRIGVRIEYIDTDVVIHPNIDTSQVEIDPYKTYCVYLQHNGTGASASAVGMSATNSTVYGASLRYKTINGTPLSELEGSSPYVFRGYALVQGIELLNGFSSSDNSTCNFPCHVYVSTSLSLQGTMNWSSYWLITLPYNMTIYNLRDGYEYMNTTDMETKRQIQHSEEVINDTLEEANDIASDTNTTTHGIFDSITDFFGSFFNNLIGIFVPDSGSFENCFSRVDTMLSNKLGILYWPFSKLNCWKRNSNIRLT